MEDVIIGVFMLVSGIGFATLWFRFVKGRSMSGDQKPWAHGILWAAILLGVGGVAGILIGLS